MEKKYYKSVINGLTILGIVLGLGLTQIGGCGGSGGGSTSTESADAVAASVYDGIWTGTTNQGKEVVFDVKGGILTYFSIKYEVTPGHADCIPNSIINVWGARLYLFPDDGTTNVFSFSDGEGDVLTCGHDPFNNYEQVIIITLTLNSESSASGTWSATDDGCCDFTAGGGFTATKTGTPADDSYEDNDIYSDAKTIAEGTYDSVAGLQCYDNDWYKIGVPDDQLIVADIFYTELDSTDETILKLGVSFYENILVIQSTNGQEDRRFTDYVSKPGYTSSGISNGFSHMRVAAWNVETAPYAPNPDTWVEYIRGTIFIEAYRLFSRGGPYEMKVSINTDDVYEDNNFFSEAAPVVAGTYNQLRLYDDDWFQINLADGATLDATVDISLYYNVAIDSIDCTPGLLYITAELYDAGGTLIGSGLINAGGGIKSTTVSYTNSSGGAVDCYLKVRDTAYNVSGTGYYIPSSTYDLRITY